MAKRPSHEVFAVGELVSPSDLSAYPMVRSVAEKAGINAFSALLMVCSVDECDHGSPLVTVMHLRNGSAQKFQVSSEMLAPTKLENASDPLIAWVRRIHEAMLARLNP